MIDFGYNINKDNQIDYDMNDHAVMQDLMLDEPTANLCIFCGSCTATCTAGSLTSFNIRKLSLLLKRGEMAEVAQEINKCMFCGKCALVCPRGVNTRKIIHLIKLYVSKLEYNAL